MASFKLIICYKNMMLTSAPRDTSGQRPLGPLARSGPCVAVGLVVYLYYTGHWKVATSLVVALALCVVSMPILLLGIAQNKNTMLTGAPCDITEHRTPSGPLKRMCPFVGMSLIVYLYYTGHWKVATSLVVALALFLVSNPSVLLASMGATYHQCVPYASRQVNRSSQSSKSSKVSSQ